MKKLLLFLTPILFVPIIIYSQRSEINMIDHSTRGYDKKFVEYSDECTIGVASGSATQDGRPMVWKTRDYSPAPNNEVIYVAIYDYNFISVSNAGSNIPYMGLNEHGFAILNSSINDLPGGSGPGNGMVMRYALGNCKTVDDFQDYLDSTNITGRATTANFGVIDANGNAAIFETGGNEYFRFNAEDEPNAYVLRTNFSINGGGTDGTERYNRTNDLVESFYSGDSLNYKSLLRYQMRDFSDDFSQSIPVPYPGVWSWGLPYGYIPTKVSICRVSTVSTAVIRGVIPNEDPRLSTMFAILGQAAGAIAVPYWPVGITPEVANGTSSAPLCDIAIDIRNMLYDCVVCSYCIDTYKLKDGDGNGLWSCTFEAENEILDSAALLLDEWRNADTISVSDILTAENNLANMAYNRLESCRDLIVGISDLALAAELVVYPNPANRIINISSEGFTLKEVILYNLTGQRVLWESPVSEGINISSLPPGMYIVEVTVEGGKVRRKLLVK